MSLQKIDTFKTLMDMTINELGSLITDLNEVRAEEDAAIKASKKRGG